MNEASTCIWRPVPGGFSRESGQAFVDQVTSDQHSGEYVCKTLKNLDRSQRMVSEIEIMKKAIAYAPVVSIVDSGLNSGPRPRKKDHPWYVMPFYRSGSLEGAVKPDVPYGGSIEAALMTYHELALGLSQLHQRRIFHRDLKTDNLLVANDGKLHMADFGLAWDGGGSSPEVDRQTGTAEQIGSRHYMSPELYSGRSDFPDEAGDIYAMAKILYAMLYGRYLLGSTSPSADEITAINHPHDNVLRRIISSGLLEEPSGRIDRWAYSLTAMRDVLYPEKKTLPQGRGITLDPARVLVAQQRIDERKKREEAIAKMRQFVLESVEHLRKKAAANADLKEVQSVCEKLDLKLTYYSSSAYAPKIDGRGVTPPDQSSAFSYVLFSEKPLERDSVFLTITGDLSAYSDASAFDVVVTASTGTPEPMGSLQIVVPIGNVRRIKVVIDDPRGMSHVEPVLDEMIRHWHELVGKWIS